jgi:hypothetical protein
MGAAMEDEQGDPVTSTAAYPATADIFARGADEISGWSAHEAPNWADLDHDARDPLTVLSSLLGADVCSDVRIDA